jgi:outer membrane immunogenic protein
MVNRLLVLLGLVSVAGAASARIDIPWDGPYLGFNIGDASSRSCNSWSINGATLDTGAASVFDSQNCSTSGSLVGGLRLGESYQFKRLVLGLGADLDFWRAKTQNETVKYTGVVPPNGTYSFSSKEGPSGFALIAPRIGYGGDTWMPYLTAGALIAAGSHNGALYFTPVGAPAPTASFNGGKNFSTTGWAAGGGFELGLNGAWSISAEYLHLSLGKGSDSSSSCSGAASTCAAFTGVTFDNTHQGFTANVVRVGITYWFGYW